MSDHGSRANLFNRPPRIARTWRVETVELPEPPAPWARVERPGWVSLGMPLLSAAALIGATMVVGQGGNALLFGLPMAVMAVMGIIATVLTNRAQARRSAAEQAGRQAFFEGQLRERREHLQSLYDAEQLGRREAQPDPESVLRIAGALGAAAPPQDRLWERRPADPDFLALRVGLGSLPFSTTIKTPRPERDSPVDPRLYALEQQYRTLADVPITIPLRAVGSLGVVGPHVDGRGLLRWLIWQAAVFHAPTDLRVAAVSSREAAAEWEWLAWLPHAVPLSNDAGFGARMRAERGAPAERLLGDILEHLRRRRSGQAPRPDNDAPAGWPPLLLVVDDPAYVRDHPAVQEILRDGPAANMFALLLTERREDLPGACGATLDLGATPPRWARAGQQWSQEPFTVERRQADVRRSDALARRLAAIRLADTQGDERVPRSVRLFDLLGVTGEADLTPPAAWATPPRHAWHPDVPIGAGAGGRPVVLDLHEQRHGPHGIIAGATGAGKSVLLQGIIAALAITHSPRQLQLLLIDFKGGASLAQLAQLPHAAGFVTDLEGRMAERAMTAITSELRARKTVFRQAEQLVGSKVENIGEYRAKAPPELPPLPNLLIVVDEFDELAQSYREFVAELVRVVKQGRSLGVHLLVASQQPARAVTDDIRTQLKFFVALRLGSSEDSREMIGAPDAALLPTDVPGRAYFRVGSEVALFQSALVTGPYREAAHAPRPGAGIILHGAARQAPQAVPQPTREPASRQPTDLDVLVRALRAAGAELFERERARTGWQPRPIWQPPLPARLTLGAIRPLPPGPPEAAIREMWRQPQPDAWLRPAVGLLDVPEESRQEPLRLPLAAGHLAVIGGSGSGKTTLLRTLLLDLALTHAPEDLWCYAVDAGGQGLSALAGLPQLGAIIQARDHERVRRLLTMVEREVRRRQELFRAQGAADLPAYRRHERLAAWLLVIDKLALLREEFKDRSGFESITDDLARLARVARPYGVHLVVTADSPRDIPYQLLALLDTRIALRLPELADYAEVLGGRVASQIPAAVPGRGLWMHPELGALDIQVALPTLQTSGETSDGDADKPAPLERDLSDGLRATVAAVRAAAERAPSRAAAVEVLPDRLALGELGVPALRRRPLTGEILAPIGREAADLQVAHLRLDRDAPHALLLGGRRSGKTSTLHTILIGLARAYAPDDLRLAVVDPRRGLAGLSRLPHMDRYAASEAEIRELAAWLQQRPEQQAGAPRLVVAVDDYDVGHRQVEGQFRASYDGAPNLFGALRRLASGEHGAHLLVAANLRYAEEAGEVVKTLEAGRNGLILWPHKFDAGTRLLDVALPQGDRDADLPPGRGLLVREEQSLLTQVALAGPPDIEAIVEEARQPGAVAG